METITALSNVMTFELGLVVLALLIAGVIAGLLAGMLGIGGGGILVPVLFETFTQLGLDPRITMHLAVGTSLAVIVPTSLRSFLGHRARGTVDMALLKKMAPWVVLGVVLGSLSAKIASSEALRIIWLALSFFLAAKLIFSREDWRLGTDMPAWSVTRIYTIVMGALATLMGIGGAVFHVTYMTLFNQPLLRAVSTSSGLGPLISVPGVIGFIWAGWAVEGLPVGTLGYVSVLGAAIIIPASVAAAPTGVRLAHSVDKRVLELVFAVFLIVAALRLLVGLIYA